MTHGHHWDIWPCQLDVCSCANKHAARWKLAPVSAVECTCQQHRHTTALSQLATRPQRLRRGGRSGGQPAHKALEVAIAIFIGDGTNKYQWTEYPLADRLVCGSCSEVTCGLCRPLACLMAWTPAHRWTNSIKLRLAGWLAGNRLFIQKRRRGY